MKMRAVNNNNNKRMLKPSFRRYNKALLYESKKYIGRNENYSMSCATELLTAF